MSDRRKKEKKKSSENDQLTGHFQSFFFSFFFKTFFSFFFFNSTTYCADKLPCGGRKQIQILTDSYGIIDFLRLLVMFTVYNVEYC